MVDNESMHMLVLLALAPPALVGAVIGFLLALFLLPGRSRSTRIGLSLIGALAGGAAGVILTYGLMASP